MIKLLKKAIKQYFELYARMYSTGYIPTAL